MQVLWLAVSVYVPEGQSVQDAPPSVANLPVTHVLPQTCASSAALPRNFPEGHVLSVHGELSVITEYLPLLHGAHEASVVAVPAANPVPVPHGGLECTTHASVPSLLEKNPGPHGAQTESSAEAVPSVYSWPALHLRTDFGLQGFASLVLLYWPAAQGPHTALLAAFVPSV